MACQLPTNLTLETILDAVKEDSNTGFCIACGADAWGVEPDAREYHCQACGEFKVYGAEELLLMVAF